MLDLNNIYNELIKYLRANFNVKADTALILGSGLGDFADNVDVIKSISTADIPGYPVSTVAGHKGKIHFAEFGSQKLLLFQGRIHFYEGYKLHQCVLPVFIANKLGCKNIIFTNAAGGINSSFSPGDLMLINSVNGINLKRELSGLLGTPSANTINSIRNFESSIVFQKIKEAAVAEKISLQIGTYWYSKGPAYETPAEIRMMNLFGGDSVGMSTVHEQIYAASLGMATGAVSCITNFAAGISTAKLSHAEVTETANLVKDKFARLIKKTIELM